MNYFCKVILLGQLIPTSINVKVIQASHPPSGSKGILVNVNSKSKVKNPSKITFGLYERNGRPAEKFEIPQTVVENDSKAKLPLQISATQDSLEKRYISHVKASLLTTIIFALIYRHWRVDPSSFFFPKEDRNKRSIFVIVFAVILYLIEAFTCSTRRYLSNALTPLQVKESLDRMKSTHPTLIWNIENYHYRTKYYHNGHGRRNFRNRHTTSTRDKVVTSRIKQEYQFER